MTATAVPDLEKLEEWKNWDQKSKDKFLAALEVASEGDKKVWYCRRGRTCDGQPHDEYDYPHARGDQWPPPAGSGWVTWLLKGGRGSGKTRSGAEWIRKMSATIERTSIIGPTFAHVRDTMVEGDSGLLNVFAYSKTPIQWEVSKRKITRPCECPKRTDLKGEKVAPHPDGHFIQLFTGEEPERLRGPQHGAVWLDEPAHIALIDTVWDMMMLGLRLGKDPKVLCSTTPLPTKWMRKIMESEDTVSVTVSTYANISNLAPTFKKAVLDQYEGTRLGRQELHGEVLTDIVGALWNWPMIEENRLRDGEMLTAEDMDRVIVGIDPAGTSDKKRDETGIIVVGKKGKHYYVLADRSGHYSPKGWAKAAWKAFDDFKADKIVAEKNYGGEMVLSTLQTVREDGNIGLVHSRRGKKLRAEPIAALYEQSRVHHNGYSVAELETQLTEWVPDQGDSPDRIDALVHALTEIHGVNLESHIATPSGNIRGGNVGNVVRGMFGLNR